MVVERKKKKKQKTRKPSTEAEKRASKTYKERMIARGWARVSRWYPRELTPMIDAAVDEMIEEYYQNEQNNNP